MYLKGGIMKKILLTVSTVILILLGIGSAYASHPPILDINITKFNDTNGNGFRDSGEPGLPDWNFTVIDFNFNTTCSGSTDANGTLLCLAINTSLNVPPYNIIEELKPGWINTTPNPILLNPDETPENISFGNTILPTPTPPPPPTPGNSEIHGMKWDDIDSDGFKNANETGVANVTICISQIPPGPPVPCTTTNASGNYSFMNLTNGTYIVGEILPPGKAQTFPPGVPSPPFGAPHIINLTAGEIRENVDFGNRAVPSVPSGNITGRKFNDSNGNGVQDIGEPGISGVSICVFPSFNCTTTNATGNYSFTVPAGIHTVFEFLPPGLIATTPIFVTVTVNASENKTVNFGNRLPVPPPEDVSIPQQFGSQNGVPTVLRPGLTVLTIRKNLTNISTNVVAVNLTLNWSDGTSKKANMTEIDATNVWEANFTAPFPPGSAQMRFEVDVFPPGPDANDSIQIGDIIFIDPSGTIRDACTGAPISGANATLLVESPPGSGVYIASPPANQIPPTNPLTTGADGIYSWLTVPGTYRVRAEKTGYITAESPNVTVPPPAIGLDISLTPTGGCPVPPPPPPSVKGKVKGEGWIVSPIPPAKKKDNKATFSFKAESMSVVSGKIEYEDHAAGLKVKGNVTGLSINKAERTAIFGGFATIKIGKNTTLGTYTVIVWDNSKKGKKNDRFKITLSTGYTANATLGGGNVKVDP